MPPGRRAVCRQSHSDLRWRRANSERSTYTNPLEYKLSQDIDPGFGRAQSRICTFDNVQIVIGILTADIHKVNVLSLGVGVYGVLWARFEAANGFLESTEFD